MSIAWDRLLSVAALTPALSISTMSSGAADLTRETSLFRVVGALVRELAPRVVPLLR
jgi:hypothetical protein